MLKYKIVFFFAIFIFFISCKKEKVVKTYRPSNEHQAYIFALRELKLDQTALGKDWIETSKNCLPTAVHSSTPIHEVFYIEASEATAKCYRFSAKRGQKVTIHYNLKSRDSARVFVDVYRVTDNESDKWYKVASAPKDSVWLYYTCRRESEYVVRFQPELLRGGSCEISVVKDASLIFPVKGKDRTNIQSFFGDPRDGGRREHHGVDIFAPRHTPVYATSRSYVTAVSESNMGGKNVWLYDSKLSANIYFAHLQTQEVERRKWIDAGTIIGTVGNTGNAKYTPPHLHFGIYLSGYGPVDPYNYIVSPNEKIDSLNIKKDYLGRWCKSRAKTSLYHSTDNGYQEDSLVISLNTALFCESINTNYCFVRLPDKRTGYIQSKDLIPITEPILSTKFQSISHLLDFPSEEGIEKIKLQPDEDIHVLAYFDDYSLIKASNGTKGWLKSAEQLAGHYTPR